MLCCKDLELLDFTLKNVIFDHIGKHPGEYVFVFNENIYII